MQSAAEPELTEAERTLAWLAEIPEAGLYGIMAAAAAAKALVPPVPADSIILLSALLAGQGAASVWIAGIVTVAAAILGTVAAYEIPRKLGPGFVRLPIARTFLRPVVLHSVRDIYDRFGPLALFISRMLPGIRHAVPVFAGMSGMPRKNALPPILLATAVWYGALVAFGGLAGHRFDQALREGRLPVGAIALLLTGLIGLYLLGRFALTLVRRRQGGGSE